MSKLCLIRGDSTYSTRISSYLRASQPKKLRIITRDIISIRGIFDISKNITKYKDTMIMIIVDETCDLKRNHIEFLLKTYSKLSIKKMSNVYMNMFLKEEAATITFELYPFGYNPVADYPLTDKTECFIDNGKGFTLKLDINNDERKRFSDWFDSCWEENELVAFNELEFGTNRNLIAADNRKAGFEYKNLRVSIKSGKYAFDIKEKYKYSEILNKTDQFYNVFCNCSVSIGNGIAVIEYSEADDNNISIAFKDEVVIKILIDSIIDMKKCRNNSSNSFDMLSIFDKKEITSEMLYSFLIKHWGEKELIDRIREKYICCKKNKKEAQHSYDITYKNIEYNLKFAYYLEKHGEKKLKELYSNLSEYDIAYINYWSKKTV